MFRKNFLFLVLFFLVVILTSACDGAENVLLERYSVFDVNAGNNKHFYFSYPSDAKVFAKNGEGEIKYNNCIVNFSNVETENNFSNFDCKTGIKEEKNKKDGGDFSAYYCENDLIAYSGKNLGFSYTFFTTNNVKNISSCIDVINFAVTSFKDYPMYENEKFSYRIKLLPEYKIDYLADDSGVVMKKWIELKVDEAERLDSKNDENSFPLNFVLEVGVNAEENILNFTDLTAFINKKYPGFSLDFFSDNNKSGVFVDERESDSAIRHFFTMSDNADTIYEVYLKVPSGYYGNYKKELEEVVKSLEIS